MKGNFFVISVHVHLRDIKSLRVVIDLSVCNFVYYEESRR